MSVKMLRPIDCLKADVCKFVGDGACFIGCDHRKERTKRIKISKKLKADIADMLFNSNGHCGGVFGVIGLFRKFLKEEGK